MASRIIEKLLNGAEVEWKSLDKVFNIKNGYTPSKSNKEYWENGTIPWFRMEDIRENGKILDDSLQKITEMALKGGKLFPKNSIIIATSATIGEHALITVPFLANQRFTVLSLKEEFKSKLEVKFLFYYCFLLSKWCKNNTTMSSFASVDMVGFRKFQIPIPPLSIQEKIVKTLDKFTELEAALEAELALRKKQYQYYRETLLTFPQNLDRGYNDITKALYHNTPVVFRALGEVCDVRDGTHDSPAKQQSGKYLITSKNVKNGTVIFDDAYFISEFDFNNINKRSKVDVNDLLFTMIGTVGEIAHITEEPDYAIKNVGLIKTGDEMLARYLFHYLQSQRAKNYIENNRSKGSQAFLALGKLRAFPIPFPSLEEQQKIVNILDKFDRLTNSISEGLPKEIALRRKQYEYYREQLLDFPRNS